jgi:hypothetical protein
MSESITEPNDFELHGKDIQIHYSMESFIGGPQLHYKTQNLSREFIAVFNWMETIMLS